MLNVGIIKMSSQVQLFFKKFEGCIREYVDYH